MQNQEQDLALIYVDDRNDHGAVRQCGVGHRGVRRPGPWRQPAAAASASFPPGPTVAAASASFPPGPGVAAASGSYPPGPTVAGIIWDA